MKRPGARCARRAGRAAAAAIAEREVLLAALGGATPARVSQCSVARHGPDWWLAGDVA